MKRTILLALMLIVTASIAACHRGTGNVRSACQIEIKKLCPSEEHAGRCLRNHPDELSDGCKDALKGANQ
jgi:hypothetical protein